MSGIYFFSLDGQTRILKRAPKVAQFVAQNTSPLVDSAGLLSEKIQ